MPKPSSNPVTIMPIGYTTDLFQGYPKRLALIGMGLFHYMKGETGGFLVHNLYSPVTLKTAALTEESIKKLKKSMDMLLA